MPNYKLGLVDRKKDFRLIDIKEFKNVKANESLQELDKYTCKFDSEKDLIKYLIDEGLYTNEDLAKKLYVLYKHVDIKKLPVIYHDTKKYMDIMYLRNTLQSLSKDMDFLEKLANHYDIGSSKFNPQLINVQILRGYIADVNNSIDKIPFESSRVTNTLDELINKAIYRYDKDNKKLDVNRNTGEVRLNYRGLRDLAIFTKKYIDRLNKKNMDDIYDELEQNDLSNVGNNLSNFTYNDNFDEPDFAPNSEEEEQYLNYIESLPDELPDYMDEESKKR